MITVAESIILLEIAAAIITGGDIQPKVNCVPKAEIDRIQEIFHPGEEVYAYVEYGTAEITFPKWGCRLVADGLTNLKLENAHLIAAFAHEVGHTVGIQNEREATCFGLARIMKVTKAFGWPLRKARQARDLGVYSYNQIPGYAC